MWPRFGIKIGNSTLCTACVQSENSEVEVLTNATGERTTPACLFWYGRMDANAFECGVKARQKVSMRPHQGICNSFQFLQAKEMPLALLYAALRHLPCEYNVNEHKFKLINHNTDKNIDSHKYELSAYQVHKKLLRNELELARQYQHDIKKKPIVVLSIPNYYTDHARKKLQQVAEDAGFHVADIIDESRAAALACDLRLSAIRNGKFVLTIKCGGLFSHFVLYKVHNGVLKWHHNFGPFYVGGDKFTEVLIPFICIEFLRKHNMDPNESSRAKARIWCAASNAKHLLTTMPFTNIYIDSLIDGLDVNVHLTRAKFESLIRPVVENFMQTLEKFLDNEPNSLNLVHIVLLGATMQIPKLKAAISNRFPHAIVHSSLPSDEIVAIGCARQAASLEIPQEMPEEINDGNKYTNEDIFIWHGVDHTKAKILLPKGTTLPYHVKVELPMCSVTQNKELFQLRAGDCFEEIFICDAQLNNDLMYCIDADVDYDSGNKKPMPLIRLRCVSQKQLHVIFFNNKEN